jgi:hypothetical protein
MIFNIMNSIVFSFKVPLNIDSFGFFIYVDYIALNKFKT